MKNLISFQFTVILAWLMLLLIYYPENTLAQSGGDENAVPSFTLDQCIDYAREHQPLLMEAQISTKIAKVTNYINLAGWLPQANISGSLVHYDVLPTSFETVNGQLTPYHAGVINTAIPTLTLSETIFNPQLFYAAKTANTYIVQAKQAVESTKINLVSNVSKTFYSLLLTLEQIDVLKEDTARLGRNVKDTYHQFLGGIVDETDYDEAVIALNNSKAQLFQQMANISPQYAALKQVMGFPQDKQFNVAFDTTEMIDEINFDTLQALQYERRIEYQQLQTSKKLQHELTKYYDLAFLPNLSVFYNYYDEYENNTFSSLFNTSYPYYNIGLSLNLPLFTGFSRLENIKKSKLQEDVLKWQEFDLKSQINVDYTTAIANYKSNLYNWNMLHENVAKAKNDYRIVSLQYKEGVVAYLNMIVAESNLISAEIGDINALFQVLSSKIDLEKALGNIN